MRAVCQETGVDSTAFRRVVSFHDGYGGQYFLPCDLEPQMKSISQPSHIVPAFFSSAVLVLMLASDQIANVTGSDVRMWRSRMDALSMCYNLAHGLS